MSASLSEAQLLELYVKARALPEQGRMMATLTYLYPASENDAIERLPLGDRDRHFWAMRQELSSVPLDAKVQCAACREWMEISPGPDFNIPDKTQSTVEVSFKGQSYELRLPNISDIIAASQDFPHERLNPKAPWQDPQFRKQAGQALEHADPGMDILFSAECKNCQTQINASFDAFRFLWTELKERAQAIISEIIALASVFGWSEAECLSLGPARRKAYLEQIL